MRGVRARTAVTVLFNCVLLLLSSAGAQPPAGRGNSSSRNLCAIIVKQLRPRWEEQSLGQSAATAGNTQYHVAVAATSPALVARQRVLLNSTDGSTTESELDPSGGIVKLTNVAAAAEVTTVVTVEFLPEFGLPALMKQFKSTAAASGTIGLFQLFSDETTCFVDPGGWPRWGDYLTCKVTSNGGAPPESDVQHLLKTAGAASQLQTAEFVMVRNESDPHEPVISIAGRLGGARASVVGVFTVSELESAGALVPIWVCSKGHVVFRPIGSSSAPKSHAILRRTTGM
jgi:hypothetical protein